MSLSKETISELISIVKRDVKRIETAINSAFEMENPESELQRINEQLEKDKLILNELLEHLNKS